MADYIDREAAIEALNKQARDNFDLSNDFEHYLRALQDAADNLKALPSADVKPIVKCKECNYWNAETHGCTRNPSLAPWWESDFCNYWEKARTK